MLGEMIIIKGGGGGGGGKRGGGGVENGVARVRDGGEETIGSKTWVGVVCWWLGGSQE